MSLEEARFRNEILPDILALASELDEDDMPSEDLRCIAEESSVEAAVRISMKYGGTKFYISKELPRKLAKMYCERHYNGSNTKELVRAVGLSERTVQRWVQKMPEARQLDLEFD